MRYTLFIDEEQKEFLEGLANAPNTPNIKRTLEGLENIENVYYADLDESIYISMVLEVKRLDKTGCMANRVIELGLLQNENFRRHLAK